MAILRLDETQQLSEPFAMTANVNQPLILGPFDEGSSLSLACIADSGEPDQGQISWWRAIDLSDQMHQKVSPQLAITIGKQSNSDISFRNVSNKLTNNLTTPNQWDSDNYMTTMSLNSDLGHLNNQEYSDYFIAFHKSAQQSSQKRVSLPHPTKLWTRIIPANSESNTIADNNYQIRSNVQLKSVLNISPLKRSHLDQEFICLAANNKLSPPLNVTIKLNLNCEYKIIFLTSSIDIFHKLRY